MFAVPQLGIGLQAEIPPDRPSPVKEEVCLSCGKTVYDGKHTRKGDFSNDLVGRPGRNSGPAYPNRFDPYEALDDITLESAGCSTRSYDAILKQVTALRAYITGMEK